METFVLDPSRFELLKKWYLHNHVVTAYYNSTWVKGSLGESDVSATQTCVLT
jgi:hypothetical protein